MAELSQENIITQFYRKNETGLDSPFPIGAEAMYVSATRGMNLNNLEEQILFGSSCITTVIDIPDGSKKTIKQYSNVDIDDENFSGCYEIEIMEYPFKVTKTEVIREDSLLIIPDETYEKISDNMNKDKPYFSFNGTNYSLNVVDPVRYSYNITDDIFIPGQPKGDDDNPDNRRIRFYIDPKTVEVKDIVRREDLWYRRSSDDNDRICLFSKYVTNEIVTKENGNIVTRSKEYIEMKGE